MTPRLDAELAARGLARSRTHAARLISAGSVTVDGRGVVKPSAAVDAASVIEVAAEDHYVSRGAHKLVAALEAFGVDIAGRAALDLGASTGGFTQVLRERGVLGADGMLTGAGVALRENVERLTDDLATGPWRALDDAEWTMRTLGGLATVLVDRGVVPVPNPMGVPRPA